jgi:adenylylsulfate kinase-like enzyme
MLADQGLLVLVAAVSGMEHLREMAAASMIPTVEVFIDVAAPAARARRLAQDASCETERGGAEETYVPPRNPTIVRNETFDPGRPVDVADLVTEIFAQLVATHPTAPAVN